MAKTLRLKNFDFDTAAELLAGRRNIALGAKAS
jgi:hypothetical protein